MSGFHYTMHAWSRRPLGHVATLQRGYDLPVQDRCPGDVPVFAANGPVGTHNVAKVPGPGVVTGRSGTIGKVHYVDGAYWPLNTALFVNDFHGNHPRFIYHLLKWMHLERFHEGTGVPTLNRNNIHDIPVSVPPLSEQKRIAAILDKADALRRKRQQAIHLTEQFLRSTFLDMFGDPVSNPKGWPMTPFGDLAENLDGRRVPVKESDRAERSGEYPYYGASGIIDYVDAYLFDETTLLIAEDGANLLARATPIAFAAGGKYWVNNHAHVVRENGRADLVYLRDTLNRRDIAGFVTGSAQPKLNQANLNRIPVPCPPLELQRRFADIVAKSDQMCQRYETSKETLERLLHSLVQRAFRGEL